MIKQASHLRNIQKCNQIAILKLLREQGPQSRAQIARALSLSPSTVTRNVAQLMDDQLVVERANKIATKKRSTGRGRPAKLIEFNYAAALVAAIDLGGAKMLGGVVDLKGNILYLRQQPTSSELSGVFGLARELLDYCSSTGQMVRAISVGVPGVVRQADGVVVSAPRLRWQNLPLKHELEEKIGIQTFVENDVNLYTLGEYYFGVGKGAYSLVYIFVGNGIGAGVVINDQLYRGTNGAAGEIGYIIPNRRFLRKRYSNKFGCLEQLVTPLGVIRTQRKELQKRGGKRIVKFAGEEPEAAYAEQVFLDACAGDFFSQPLVTTIAEYLAIAVINIAAMLDPEIIVLGGEIVKAGNSLLKTIKKLVRRAVPFTPDLMFSMLGEKAGLLGATALVSRDIDRLLVEKE